MKTVKRTALLVAIAMLFSAVGFSSSLYVVDAAAKKPTKITLKATSKSVDIKGKVTVSVKSVKPKGANKAVKFQSSNKKIATVNSKGVVTGKKKGKVTITATSKKNKKVKAKIKITVKQMKPKVTITKKATMYSGINQTLTAKVGPKGVYNKGIKYSSSNTSIATVSSKGVVTPKKGGTVKITATSKENKKYKAVSTVTVRQSVTGISFAKSVLDLKTRDKATNAITVSPANAYSKAVTYTSSNTKVATVNSGTGEVYAVAPGTATITATANVGLKTKGSYTVIIKDNVLEPTIDQDEATFVLNPTEYSAFEISAIRPASGTPISVEVTPADLEEMFDLANGEGDFDWTDATDMKAEFGGANFDYSMGTDFIFSKTGNKVTIKIPGDNMRTNWYYDPTDSFIAAAPLSAASDYTIRLFEKTDGTGSYVDLKRVGDELKVDKAGRSMSITVADSDAISASFTSGGTTMTAKLIKDENGGITAYDLVISLDDIAEFDISLIAYK